MFAVLCLHLSLPTKKRFGCPNNRDLLRWPMAEPNVFMQEHVKITATNFVCGCTNCFNQVTFVRLKSCHNDNPNILDSGCQVSVLKIDRIIWSIFLGAWWDAMPQRFPLGREKTGARLLPRCCFLSSLRHVFPFFLSFVMTGALCH